MTEKLFIIGKTKESKWKDLVDPLDDYYIEDVVNQGIYFVERDEILNKIDDLFEFDSEREVGLSTWKKILKFIDPRRILLNALEKEVTKLTEEESISDKDGELFVGVKPNTMRIKDGKND